MSSSQKTARKKKQSSAAKKTRRTPTDRVTDRNSFLDGTDSAAIAESMSGKKTKENTKKQYEGKTNFLREYLEKEFEDSVTEEGEINIPIEENVLVQFFGFIMASAHARDKLKSPDDIPEGEADPWSVSQISGYKSAIVSLYRPK